MTSSEKIYVTYTSKGKTITRYVGRKSLESWSILQINGITIAISSLGRVRRPTGELINQFDNGKGYLRIDAIIDGERVRESVHRLVLMAFLPCGDNSLDVNHKSNDSLDNTLLNLEWNTRQENNEHSRRWNYLANIRMQNKFNNKHTEEIFYKMGNLNPLHFEKVYNPAVDDHRLVLTTCLKCKGIPDHLDCSDYSCDHLAYRSINFEFLQPQRTSEEMVDIVTFIRVLGFQNPKITSLNIQVDANQITAIAYSLKEEVDESVLIQQFLDRQKY